jgi:hypothetical protein
MPVLAVLALLGPVCEARGGQAVPPAPAPGGVTIQAVRLEQPLTLDGHLDEPVYGRVAPYSTFIQQEPVENAPASERTDLWVFFDRDTLFICARNVDSQMDRIVEN